MCSFAQAERGKEQRLVVVGTSSLPQGKPMPAKWKPNFSFVLKKPFTANWERNSMACAIQKHIFLLMRLRPKPQEIWFSKEACICSPKLFMPNYRGNSLVWEGSTFSPNTEKEKI